MKLRIISCALGVLVMMPTQSSITVDPALTAAITAQTGALKKVYDTRAKRQQAIIAAETAATLALTKIHQVENKVLEYLSNASGAMQNIYQIKRAAELATKEIPSNIKLVTSSIPHHLRGTAIAAIVSDEIRDASSQMAALYPLIAQLVSSGSYNVQDVNGKTKKKKVNLLDASERYYIANEIVTRLESINTDLYLLAWQIRTYSFSDLFFHLSPESWCNIMAGKSIAEGIIREYSYL